MKLKLQVQFNNKNVETTNIEKLVKEDVKAQGVKMTTVDTLEVYYKPEDSSVYYVATTKTGEVVGNDQPLSIKYTQNDKGTNHGSFISLFRELVP